MTFARLREITRDQMMPALNEFVAQVSILEQIEKIILFGSLSKGLMTQASDIDLAILLEETAHIRDSKEQIRQLKRIHLSWPCDLLVMKRSWFESRKDFGGICMEIAVSGETLYEKSILAEGK